VTRVAKAYLRESNRTIGVYIPETAPDRVEIPAAPDINSLVKDYKGGRVRVSQGEAFDPTPAMIESRVQRFTLANGLKLALLPKKTRGGSVTATLWLPLGDEKSLFGRKTAGEIVPAMLMRGTKRKSRQQIQEEMDRLKARFTLVGSAYAPRMQIETTEENLAGAFRLATEILRDSAFPEAEFEQLRQARIANSERRRTDPAYVASQAMGRHMSPYPPGAVRYVSTVDEEIEASRNVTVDQVRDFYQRFWGVAAAGGVEPVLAVSGQFEPTQCANWPRSCWERGKAPAIINLFLLSARSEILLTWRWRQRTSRTLPLNSGRRCA
jgi:zinc protease